jgi:hypothetical protein
MREPKRRKSTIGGNSDGRLRASRHRTVIVLTVVTATLAACMARGVPQDPISMKLQWFSYLDGADIRKSCGPGAPDRYRLVYNARYNEQVRTYEVELYEQTGRLVARATSPGVTLYQTDAGLDFGWQRSERRLDPGLTERFRKALKDSGVYGPTPVELELISWGFYWVVALCEEGRFHFNAFVYPSEAFKRLTFPDYLFAHDATGVRVNPPRPTPVGERFLTTGGGPGPRDDNVDRGFLLRVDEDGLMGTTPLIK